MHISIESLDGAVLVRVEGDIDRNGSGSLYDTLVDLVASGENRLILDLSAARSITRAGARGIVVAARLLRAPHGMMRVCGATAAVDAVIAGLGYDHFIRRDADLESALAAIDAAPIADRRRIRVNSNVRGSWRRPFLAAAE